LTSFIVIMQEICNCMWDMCFYFEGLETM